MNTRRRAFIIHSTASCGALLATGSVLAQAAAPELVKETDAAAMAVGYLPDATKVDKRKHPTYAQGQRCGVCILFEGKPADRSGACPLFPGKHVAASGWCSSWAKKV